MHPSVPPAGALGALLLLGPAPVPASGGAVTGFVAGEACARSGSGLACAARPVADGSPAVVVTPAGRVFEVADQPAIAPFAGRAVSIGGEIRGRRFVSVDSVVEVGIGLRGASRGTAFLTSPARQRPLGRRRGFCLCAATVRTLRLALRVGSLPVRAAAGLLARLF